jgi:hypothetical protein
MPEVLPPLKDEAPNGGNGRPRGARNLKHRTLERAARSHSLPIVMKMIEQALEGDTIAAKIILDRTWPRPRMMPLELRLPETKTPAELRAAMHDLLAKIASGTIAPDQGAAFMSVMRDVLESHRIQTFDPSTAVAVETTNARNLLADKLAKAIEARKRQGE